MMKNKLPKLMALDLDGTVVDDSGRPTPRVKRAIENLKSNGVQIVFVTGRPPRWMYQISESFDSGIAIIANGALLYDLKKQNIVESRLLDIENQIEIVKRLRTLNNIPAFAREWIDGFNREKNYIPRWDDGIDPVGVEKIEETIQDAVYKMLVQSKTPKTSPDIFLEEINSKISDLAEVTYCNLGVSLVEISRKGANKKNALEDFASKLGINQNEVFAIGDNINDFEMLKWAGQSWVMASGHPNGSQFATKIAPEFENDGVAQVIEELLR